MHLYNFLTASDHAILDDRYATPAARDSVVATRLDKFGIRRRAEDGLIKRAIVVLANCELKLTAYHATYNQVVSFKKLLQGLPPYGAQFTDRYHEHSRDLPT